MISENELPSAVTDDNHHWAAVREKLGEVHIKDFISVDHQVLTSEIPELDEIMPVPKLTTKRMKQLNQLTQFPCGKMPL
ncbi:hypothetical protein ANN_09560 [Periplaneta americana]|uniref:Uncharacterized protein n=1 Tax=Periplaneta americana TaxID=6978 RepID=A0ABQ8TLN3_PERAM|nr:hypothetical protein ANN_09560 [Periplaneta americana]